jgi:hypothetical protein
MLAGGPEITDRDRASILDLATRLEAATDVEIETQMLLIEAWEICSAS